jgi:hypothetical protein
MKITADLQNGNLAIGGVVYEISNSVRSLKNGARKSSEVIRSIPDNLPYDPRPFPKGLWNATGVEWQKDKKFDYNTYGPVKIRTDAWQAVKVWELDGDGDYFRETGREVKDGGYLLHYSKSLTTLGCIRLAGPGDAEAIAAVIQRVLGQGEKVELEVV